MAQTEFNFIPRKDWDAAHGSDNQAAEADTLIIYHGGGCSDGFTCAWLFNRLASSGITNEQYGYPGRNTKAVYAPVTYGSEQNIPTPDGMTVFILDYSIPKEALFHIASVAKAVYVMDHHKSSLPLQDYVVSTALENVVLSIDTNRAGCQIVWDLMVGDMYTLADSEHVFNHMPMLVGKGNITRPAFIQFLGAADTFNLENIATSQTDTVWHYASLAANTDKNMEAWDELAMKEIIRASAMGALYSKAYTNTCRSVLMDSGAISALAIILPDGREVLCAAVNASRNLRQGIAAELKRMFSVLPSAIYYVQDGQMCFSLRSDDERDDVSEIAAFFGGGGHRNAAGFSVSLQEVEWIRPQVASQTVANGPYQLMKTLTVRKV